MHITSPSEGATITTNIFQVSDTFYSVPFTNNFKLVVTVGAESHTYNFTATGTTWGTCNSKYVRFPIYSKWWLLYCNSSGFYTSSINPTLSNWDKNYYMKPYKCYLLYPSYLFRLVSYLCPHLIQMLQLFPVSLCYTGMGLCCNLLM